MNSRLEMVVLALTDQFCVAQPAGFGDDASNPAMRGLDKPLGWYPTSRTIEEAKSVVTLTLETWQRLSGARSGAV